jgi:ubiquinone/menaquinone biosynthesis C-methylase UbiE
MVFTDILNKYSSTNTSFGTDKNTTHSYGDVYNHLFKPYIESSDSILEIGFDCGASLQAYSEYFKNANIYGIDIRDNMNPLFKYNPKITTHIGDATEQNVVNYFDKKFDIIIEDGSHLVEHQIKHFMDFQSKVKAGGLYIIEDVHEMYSQQLESSLKEFAEKNGFSLEIIDLRNLKNRFDDILFVFKKKV